MSELAAFPVTIAASLTAADWTAKNPTLDQYQIGVEKDTLRAKVNLRSTATAWNDLTYLNTPGASATAAEIDQFNDVSAYQEAIVLAGALSVTKKYSSLAVPTGGAVTLAVPAASMLGQIKVIEMITDDGDVTLDLTNVVGQSSGTTATFDTAGDKLILIAAFDKWVVVKEFGVTLS